ncbi:MAG: glycosyltransferase [Deltaproteobacteria bacterium]|nr:glycosyltransferase [Deltaproteobacteria bacterium]
MKRRIPQKKILFAIGSLELGGAETQMLLLIQGLVQVGLKCKVFVLNGQGKLRPKLETLSIPVISAWKRESQKKRPWLTFVAQLQLIHTTIRYRPDVFHAFLPLVTFMGAVAGKLCRVPLVITSRRALGTHQERYRLLRPLDLMANAWSHRVTVNSKAVWNDVVRRDHIDPHKLTLIYNAVDTKPYKSARSSRMSVRQKLGLKPREKAVIVIANLIPYKGHSDLFRAVALAIRKVPEIRLIVVGEDRGIGNYLKREASLLGIGEAVKFLGQRWDVPELLAASDLSVLASHEEGFSNVILESMAAGLPVVATDVGGNREAIVDGETGWLVPPRNPVVMAEKIIMVLRDQEWAKKLGAKGQVRVKDMFSVDKMIKSHLELYGMA